MNGKNENNNCYRILDWIPNICLYFNIYYNKLGIIYDIQNFKYVMCET